MISEKTIFSYSRDDSEFVLKLAKDLRNAHANIWLDQLDIEAGSHWDMAIETAMKASECVIVVLSPKSVSSFNVMDEVSYALEEGKRVVPILFKDCSIPLRLRRLQYIDFRIDYAAGFDQLIKTLHFEKEPDTTFDLKDKTDEEETIWQHANQIRSIEVFQSYLEQYPEGKFKISAIDKIKKLEVEKHNEIIAEQKKHIEADTQHKAEEERQKLIEVEVQSKAEEQSEVTVSRSKHIQKRKNPIFLYGGIIFILAICVAGYFIFKTDRPGLSTTPENDSTTLDTNPSVSASLSAIKSLAEQKKYMDAIYLYNTLPNDLKSQKEYVALIIRIEELKRLDSLESINKNIDALSYSANQLASSAYQFSINRNCSEAKRKYTEALNIYKKVLAINPQNRLVKGEILKITNTLDTLCKNTPINGTFYEFSVRRYPVDGNIQLLSILISENETIITLELKPTTGNITLYDPGSEGAFLIEYNNRSEHLNLKSIKGIQTGQSINGLSKPKSFQLIFNKLPENVSEFNLLEGENQADDTQSHWNIIGIKLIKQK